MSTTAINWFLATDQAPYRASLLASVMLILTLLQGTSTTLTLAVRSPFSSDLLASLVTVLWLGMHAHNGLLQIASEIGLPLAVIALLMILQQFAKLIYCQCRQAQREMLFVIGFVVALLVSNYSETRLLVNRELYWIFFLALPISMLQQVTLSAERARGMQGRFALLPSINDRIVRSRERITQRRLLEKRLKNPSKITIIGQRDSSENQLTDGLGNVLFAADAAEKKEHGRAHEGHALIRKLTRRQRKAG